MEGKPLPALTFTDHKGKPVKTSDLKAPYVLYVYPEDDTPTCTVEACNLRDNHAALRKAGLTVYGLSPDDAAKHQKFIAKYELPFTLLTTDQKGLERLGVWKEKQMFGNRYMGVSRETFLVGADGKVLKHYGRVISAEHGEHILADFKALA
jgi:thioredoxin-dependent peroxiredoxin